jgi:hypothetical protein
MANLEAYGTKMVGPVTTGLPASSVTYNNTSSGLAATNIQAAIDELAGTDPVTHTAVVQVNPAVEPTANGAIWIETN